MKIQNLSSLIHYVQWLYRPLFIFIVTTLSLFTSLVAQSQCDTLPDQSAYLRSILDAQKVASIPAGETWRVDQLELKDDESLFGLGTICKASSSEYALKVTGNNVQIKDLTFAPQTVSGQPNCDIHLAEGSQHVKIESNHFVGQTYSAVCAAVDSAVGGQPYFIPASNIIIQSNTFDGYVRPLFLHSVSNITISNNIISRTLRDAIRLRENNGYVIISNNQFIDIGNGVNVTDTQDAIDSFWSGQKLVISDNIVKTTEGVGFDIKGVDPDNIQIGSRSVIIANNLISETRFSAIVLHGDLDTDAGNYSVILDANIIEDSVRSASYADAAIWAKGSIKHLTISNNQLRSNLARGITVQTRSGESDGSVSDVHINGNIVINNGVGSAPSSIGIYLQGVQGAIVTGNTAGNDPTLSNATTRFGIYATKLTDGIVKNNLLTCNSNTQISITGTNLIVSDNLQTNASCP
ncbi:right-handed parallel beta-helix repeat-containing protein [Aliiglaciecola litoralis]|uniref:Right handed beta helix domain-containing protein n=1 Tax=Aliiglaciecola litoralis TaxID=582857 RepID=A0ABN1LEI5_9ALTE